MKLIFLKVTVIGLFLAISSVAHVANARLLTFTDKATFDAYTGGGVVDDLESADSNGTVISGDFYWTMIDYNCRDGSGCHATSSGNRGMMQSDDDDFIWTYDDGEFVFAEGIASFGIQFGSYYGGSAVILNGQSSGVQASGSFFGIASDDNTLFTNVLYAKSHVYGSFDDVTYSRSNQSVPSVSEPSTLAIFALSVIGLTSRRFKKKS